MKETNYEKVLPQSELEILMLTKQGLPEGTVGYKLKKLSTSPVFQ